MVNPESQYHPDQSSESLSPEEIQDLKDLLELDKEPRFIGAGAYDVVKFSELDGGENPHFSIVSYVHSSVKNGAPETKRLEMLGSTNTFKNGEYIIESKYRVEPDTMFVVEDKNTGTRRAVICPQR